MKKVFLFLLTVTALSISHAATNPPRDQKGNSLATVDFSGVSQCGINAATGTVSILCASGRVIVYGVIGSSIAYSDYLVFRDTGTAGVTAATTTVVFNTLAGLNVASTLNPTTNFIKFPVPIRFTQGLTVTASGTPVANSISRWTILYRLVNSTDGD